MQPVVISARMVMVVPVVDGSLLQATRETCSPVQLQQLLQHDVYPEDDAAAQAAQARARVLIYSRTVALSRSVAAARHIASLQSTPFISRVAAFALRWSGGVRRLVARRIVYLLLLLLACFALYKFRRGGGNLVIQMLLRYRRH
jgi:hypothetical protein